MFKYLRIFIFFVLLLFFGAFLALHIYLPVVINRITLGWLNTRTTFEGLDVRLGSSNARRMTFTSLPPETPATLDLSEAAIFYVLQEHLTHSPLRHIDIQMNGLSFQRGSGDETLKVTAEGVKSQLLLSPQTIDVELALDKLNTLFQFKQIFFRGRTTANEVQCDQLRFGAFGGQFTTQKFSVNKANLDTKLTLRVRKVSFAELTALYPATQLAISGTVSGVIPLAMKDGQISIKAGQLKADGPGLIKYQGDTSFLSGDPRFALAATVLKNLHYSELTAGVEYKRTGELTLAVHILGSNPEVNKGEQVNVNVNIEENIPKLLRSLRLAAIK